MRWYSERDRGRYLKVFEAGRRSFQVDILHWLAEEKENSHRRERLWRESRESRVEGESVVDPDGVVDIAATEKVRRSVLDKVVEAATLREPSIRVRNRKGKGREGKTAENGKRRD